MKNKKLMNNSDKKEYLIYKTKVNLLGDLFKIIFFTIIIYFIQSEIIRLPFLLCLLIVIGVFLIFSKPLKVFMIKDTYITDGHIFKKHTFINNSGSSEYNTGPYTKARAISEDNSITTPWIYYPKHYYKEKEMKVKIVIQKNKAIDFYISK